MLFKYREIPSALGWDVSEDTIRHALRKAGFSRRVTRQKPSISEANRLLRLAWAREHVNWTKEQWESILWSDETWVNGIRHRKIWVIRRSNEEYDPTCLITRAPGRGPGWMFWACFFGSKKGSCLFWEKDWGTINKQSYCERIVPLVHGWMMMSSSLLFVQDNAPGHAAQYTRDELQERSIHTIFWPPFSPDLNPIEKVWNWMKD